MSSAITDDGKDWLADRAIDGDGTPDLEYVGVGVGVEDPEASDTELGNEVYLGSATYDSVDFYRGDEEVGVFYASIILSGGVEVDPDSEITEFGVFDANENLLYREVRDAIAIGSGNRVALELDIEFTNV